MCIDSLVDATISGLCLLTVPTDKLEWLEKTKNLHFYFGLRRFLAIEIFSGPGNAPGTLEDGMEVIVSSVYWQTAWPA